MEELNLKLKNFKHFASYNYSYEIDEIKLHFFLSNVKELKLTLKVHESYKLVTVKQLSQLDWLAADQKVINMLQSKYLWLNMIKFIKTLFKIKKTFITKVPNFFIEVT